MSPSANIPGPTPPPDGYAVVAFRVAAAGGHGDGRVVAVRIDARLVGGRIPVSRTVSRAAGAGRRVTAVAWFADAPLDDAPSGRERLVARLPTGVAGGKVEWSQWEPDEVPFRATPPKRPAAPVVRRSTGSTSCEER